MNTPARPSQESPAEIPPLPFPPARILVPLDFSEHSLKALPLAEACARQFHSRLLVLNVAEPATCPTDVVGCAPVITVEMNEDLARASQMQLDKEVAKLRQAGLDAEGILRSGSAQSEIAAAAADLKADLVVVTTHGYTGLKHVLLGSTAERVVRHAPCPVLVVRERTEAPQAGAALTLRRILVPVDFSGPAQQALAYASGLARQFGAELILTHVVEPALTAAALSGPDGGLMGAGLEIDVMEKELETSAGQRLAALAEAERKAGLRVSSELLTGTPWSEIASLATRAKVDLVVAGTHGYTGLKHVLLGSTAERIVRHAPCPVLVVRGANLT